MEKAHDPLLLESAYLADLVYVPQNSKSKDPPGLLPFATLNVALCRLRLFARNLRSE